MKDREARTSIESLRKEVAALRKAFDALFDVVAEDLGYEAAMNYDVIWPGYTCRPGSPRTFAVTRAPEKLLRRPGRVLAKKVRTS